MSGLQRLAAKGGFLRSRFVKICTMRFRGNAADVATSIMTSVGRSVCGMSGRRRG